MAHKLLLDTDIGSDIDDAVCLAYLLAQPECDLMGITTVSGEPVLRARLASALCRAAHQDVPIYPGAANPLIVAQRQTTAAQAAALDRWPHTQDFPTGEAVEFLRRTIRAHPHEITLLTIGPLTNIALLFAVDPEIPSLLKQLVMMCGVFTGDLPQYTGKREWNAMLDPHASAIVYAARPAVHRSVGLDVTAQVVLPAAEVRARFHGPQLAPVLDFAEVWFAHSQNLTFHDPLAAVCLFDDQVCRFEHGMVEVELQAGELQGQTIWHEDPHGPHEVALGVDANRFFERYFAVFAGAPA
jgi:inosine-uridine nucleoside N-ribohydrolase